MDNCTFTSNFGQTASAISLLSGSKILDHATTFENNTWVEGTSIISLFGSTENVFNKTKIIQLMTTAPTIPSTSEQITCPIHLTQSSISLIENQIQYYSNDSALF